MFVISETPESLYQELKKIPRLTRMLGRENAFFFPLSEMEEQMVQGIGDQEHMTVISRIKADEGKKIRVIDGPLKDYVGDVVKVNLHKREVVVRVEFMGKMVELFMGVEMVVDDKCQNI